MRRILSPLLLAIVFGTVSAYALFALRNAYRGPQLVITPHAHHVELGVTTLTGVLTRGQSLTVNGQSISFTTDGVFSEHVVLTPGDNQFTFHASDRFGATTESTLRVWYEVPKLSPATPPPTTPVSTPTPTAAPDSL